MTIYKLYNEFTSSADSGALLDIQFDGVITAIDWNVRADLDADTEAYNVELSFLSTNTFTVNDSRGSISMVGAQASGTPGFIDHVVAKGLSGLAIPVTAGERVHLHGTLAGTASVRAHCYLHVEDRADPRLRRRR